VLGPDRGTRIELRAGDAAFGPGEVPIGVYTVWAFFEPRWRQVAVVNLTSNATFRVDCNPIFHTCDAQEVL
jgi:hypothetical protein